MRYIKTDFSKVIPWDAAFDKPPFTHGKFKVGFGEGEDSVNNPVLVCVKYNAGDRLLEVADWSDGSSGMGATMGGDRNIVVADYPFAKADDTGGDVLGVLQYRQGLQPQLFVDGEQVTGGASRFSSFVSETGMADEDPKPRSVRDETHEGQEYYVHRKTGHAAYGTYYVHAYRLNVNEGQAYPALTLENSGQTPQTDTVYPKPITAEVKFCSTCGAEL